MSNRLWAKREHCTEHSPHRHAKNLLRGFAVLLLTVIITSAAYAQGSNIGSNSSPVFNRQGIPLPGINVAVCQPVATTAASVTSNIGVLTLPVNPLNVGFAPGKTIMVQGFTGADVYLNNGTLPSGPLTNGQIVGGWTILSVTSSTITFTITHANAAATTNGTVLQQGDAQTPCGGLAAVFADPALTQPVTQPFQTDQLGNWNVFGVQGGVFYVQFFSPVTLTVIKLIVSGGGSGGGTGCGAGGCVTQLNSFVGPVTIIGGTNVTISNAGNNITINSTASCVPGGIDTSVQTQHPLGVCYGSQDFTWNDTLFKLQAGNGTSTFGATSTLQFVLGSNDSVCTTASITCTNFYVFGHNNSIEGASGHTGDPNNSDQYVTGFSNTTANAQWTFITGFSQSVTADASVVLNNLESVFALGHNETVSAITGSSLLDAYLIGHTVGGTCSGGSTCSDIWAMGRNLEFDATGTGADVDDCLLLGLNNLVQANTANSVSSSCYLIGEGNQAISTGASLNEDNYAFGEVNKFLTSGGASSKAFFNVSIGFTNTLNSASNQTIQTSFLFGTTNTITASSATVNPAMALGSHLSITDCSDCYLFGRNGSISGSSFNAFVGIGVSATPELQITASTIKLAYITGSVQCLQVTSLGVIQGTGATCGSGGGGSSIFTQWQFFSQTAIATTGNYIQLTGSSFFAGTQTGLGTAGSPFIDTLSVAAAAGGTVFANNTSGSAVPVYTATPILGINASVAGSLGIANGAASGTTTTIQNLHATVAINFNLPATVGTAGFLLTSQGGGTNDMTWTQNFTSINGISCQLGNPCTTLTIQTVGSATANQNLLNLIASTTNQIGLILTPSNPSGGNVKLEATGLLNPLGGGTGISNPAAHSLLIAEGGSAFNLITSPTINGLYICGFNVFASAAVDPGCTLQGVPIVVTSSTAPTQMTSLVDVTLQQFTGAATAQIGPVLANNITFALWVTGTGPVTYTPASGLVNSAGTWTIPKGWFCFEYTDNTNTQMPCMPTPAAIPITTASQALTFNGTTFGTLGNLVIGPGSATNLDLVCFNGTTGLLVSDCNILSTTLGGVTANYTAHTWWGRPQSTTGAPAANSIGTADTTPHYWGAGGGTAQAQTVTLTPAIAAADLTDGLEVCWKPTAANTAAAPTLAVNGTTATTITKLGNTALVANDIVTTANACVVFNSSGPRWELQNFNTQPSAGVSSFTGDGAFSSNSGSTGAVTFTLANAGAHKWWGNNTGSTAAPGYQTIGINDLPGGGATTVNGATCTLGAACNVETAASGQVAISGGSGAALTGAADLTYSTHTFSAISTTIFDLSASTGTAAFIVPKHATNTATAAGVIDFDTTNSNYHFFISGADAIGAAFASAPAGGKCLQSSGTAGLVTEAAAACGSGGGGVTSFSGDGALISNSSSTGAVTATLGNAAASTVWGRNATTSGAPAYFVLATDLGTITYTSGGTTTFAAAGAVWAAGIVTATHATSTTFSPTGLVKWGKYQVEIKQDSTGGGVTFTLGTAGSCSAWKVLGGGGGAITLSTGVSAIDVLYFTFDGTNCVATFANNAT